MIILNLIPPGQKKDLKQKRIYVTIKELVMLILLFTSIVAILLLVAKNVLEEQLAYLIEKNATTIQVSQSTNRQIYAINQKITAVDKIQKDSKRWSVFFNQLAQLTPNRISYSLAKVYRQEGVLELQGTAKTTNDLIQLQKNLEDSSLFKKINLPLSDLLAKENSSFNLRAEIDLSQVP